MILSRKNNEPTLFILFRAMIVITSIKRRYTGLIEYTKQTLVRYTFERASKGGLLLQKRKFSFVGAHMTN